MLWALTLLGHLDLLVTECIGKHISLLFGFYGSLRKADSLNSSSAADSYGNCKRGFVAIPFLICQQKVFLGSCWEHCGYWNCRCSLAFFMDVSISRDGECWHAIVTHNSAYMPISFPSGTYVPPDVKPLVSSLHNSIDAASLRYNECKQEFSTSKGSIKHFLYKAAEKFDFLCLWS